MLCWKIAVGCGCCKLCARCLKRDKESIPQIVKISFCRLFWDLLVWKNNANVTMHSESNSASQRFSKQKQVVWIIVQFPWKLTFGVFIVITPSSHSFHTDSWIFFRCQIFPYLLSIHWCMSCSVIIIASTAVTYLVKSFLLKRLKVQSLSLK